MRITERMSAQKNLSIKSAPNRGWPLNYVGMRDSQRTCLENPNSLKPKIKKKINKDISAAVYHRKSKISLSTAKSMGSQRVGQDWATKRQQPNLLPIRTDTTEFRILITHRPQCSVFNPKLPNIQRTRKYGHFARKQTSKT